MIDYHKLVVFITVYRTLSISDAAESLGLTQPAVSNSLKALRACFQDSLFTRTGGGVRATATAHTLAAKLTPIFTSLKETIELFAPDKFQKGVAESEARVR
ncbi:helix-turn-helix domain-containing protein [Pseudomonas putida]|uniref:LysR family transcriptional regulator n=1 Tax=Pseudomonas putida TaxID=303 RepID=A0A8I1EGX2_PSEPU|nr:LysR family transcriptional regulator [Pseudomonas putida]MBI6885019.1 LysR family transcriptional regulator [Pseudomonas putida]